MGIPAKHQMKKMMDCIGLDDDLNCGLWRDVAKGVNAKEQDALAQTNDYRLRNAVDRRGKAIRAEIFLMLHMV